MVNPIRVEVVGGSALRQRLSKIPLKQQSEMQRALTLSALDIRNEAIRSIQQGPATGVTYGNHQASAPGEAPSTDTGFLVGSIQSGLVQSGKILEAIAGTDLDYGIHLEFGTRNMAARPWLQPAFERKKKTINARLHAAFKKANRPT